MSEKVWMPFSSENSLGFRHSEYSSIDDLVTGLKDGLRCEILYVEINVQQARVHTGTHACTARNSCVLLNKCFHYWFTNLAGFPVNVLKNYIDLNHLLGFFYSKRVWMELWYLSHPSLHRCTLEASSSLLDTGMPQSATCNTPDVIRRERYNLSFSEGCIVSLS